MEVKFKTDKEEMKALIKKSVNYVGRLKNLKKTIGNLIDNAVDILDNLLNKHRANKDNDLIVLDDIYPHLLSAFRIAEYNYLLGQFANSEVHSTATAFSILKEKRKFSEVVVEYERHYPQFKGRVVKFNRHRRLNCKLIYVIFLNNAFKFIDYIDEVEIPFVFTLYPGGGFHLREDESNQKLRRVFSSPNFRNVIVTQKITYEYLIENKFCTIDKITFIYGGVLPSVQLSRQLAPKKYYKKDKNTFDICFVAHKYLEMGIDKGYDVFIEVAKNLRKQKKDIFFHVVGRFDRHDIDVTGLDDCITFYGTKNTNFFPAFYSKMDIILSPNIPFVLAPGAFDGFPTGCCIEAGLCGVAVLCKDVLKLNLAFKDREEIVIIPDGMDEIVSIVLKYHEEYNDLYQLAINGKAAFNKIFDIQLQMSPRTDLLSQYLC